MKTIQSIDDIKKASDNVSLPSINVQQDVMQKIYRRKKKNMFRNKKIIITIVAAVFLIFTVGFTVTRVWDLNGPGGSPFKFSLFNENKAAKHGAGHEEWKNVKPGGALALLKTKDNSNNRISITLKPLTIDSIEKLRNSVGSNFKQPSNIPSGYTFSEGEVNTNTNDFISDSMIAEAKTTQKEYIVRVIEPSQEIGSYRIIYRNQDKLFDVSLTFNWKGSELSQPDQGQEVSKVDINGFEAIYTNGNGRSEIKWIDSSNGANILYSAGCPSQDLTKDELLQVAKSIK